MAVNPIGVSFAPTDEQALESRKNMSLAGSPEAVRILSLQIPKFAGSRAIAPDALLQAQPSSPAASVVESILRSMGMGGAAPQPGGSGESRDLADQINRSVNGGSPTPTVRPTPPVDSWQDSGGFPIASRLPTAARLPVTMGSRPQRPKRYEPTPVVRPGIDTAPGGLIPQTPVQRMFTPPAPAPSPEPTTQPNSDYRTQIRDKNAWGQFGGDIF